MCNEVPELLTQVSDGLLSAISYAVFQVAEHWHHWRNECNRKGYMTEHQKRNNTVTVSMLLNLLKAEIERLTDLGSRKPTSSTQWKPFGQLKFATKDIVQHDVCRQSTQFTPWLTIACNHRACLANMRLTENRREFVRWLIAPNTACR